MDSQLSSNSWLFTSIAVLFSVLFPIRYLFCGSKKSSSNTSNPASVIVDKKERIRELNPLFIPTDLRNKRRNKAVFYDSVCDAVKEHLKQCPDQPVFGSHSSPSAPYEWISFKQFADMFSAFGSGLKHKLGVEPNSNAMVGIYAINCIEWVASHFGLLFYSNVAVPLYSTLGDAAIVHIVKHTGMSICVCFDEGRTDNLLDSLVKAFEAGDKSALNTLRHLIIMRSKSPESMAQLQQKYASVAPNLRFHTFESILEAGRGKIVPFRCPSDDGMYIMNFTSGTTGIPKGVIITNKMFTHLICTVIGSENILGTSFHWPWIDGDDVYFSFLPLAHVLEQLLMAATIFCRARVGFFSGEITKLIDDMGTLKPTIVALVPRLLIRIYDTTLNKLSAKHIPKWVLNHAVKSKLSSFRQNGGPVNNTIWDRLIFRTLQEKVGGRLRLIITGSASCPKDVLDFTRVAYGATLHVGYGSTETGGVVTLSFSDDIDSHHVGVILKGMQIKLGDVPDMDIFPSTNPSETRGEILVKGPSCTPGYYKDDEKTRELIDSQGWLHTGDVGKFDEQGRLCIVDRCKNLFKLSQGEYVAPDRVEGIYATSTLVAQVFLDGKSDSFFAIALVHPNGERLAEKLGMKFRASETASKTVNDKSISMADLCRKPEAEKLVLSELTSAGKAGGLSGFEMAKKIKLIDEPFSIENGLLTSTMKPVRAKIRQFYEQEIKQLYATGL